MGGTFDHLVFTVNRAIERNGVNSGSWGLEVYVSYLRMAYNSKNAGHRAKWSEMCNYGPVVLCIWGTFLHLVFNVFLWLSQVGLIEICCGRQTRQA